MIWIHVFLIKNIKYSIFADDIAIWMSSRNLNFVVRQIQKTLDNLCDWFFRWGFNISINKSVVLPFSRSKVKIKLTMQDRNLETVDNFKFLGVIFDSRLNWSCHINYVRDKCIKRLNILKRISGSSWGASKHILVILYKALIRSVIDYGSIVYDSAHPNALKKLDVIQNRCLRLCCGAMCATPISYLENECGVPPLCIHRKHLQLKYIVRSLYYDINDDYLNDNWRHYYGKFKPHNIPIVSKLRDFFEIIDIDTIARYEFISVPPWYIKNINVDTSIKMFGHKNENPHDLYALAMEKITAYNNYTCIYTDGSMNESYVSSAYFVKNSNFGEAFKLNHSSIFKAELFAILKGLEWATEFNIQQVLIISDSLSSLMSIQSKQSSSNTLILNQILVEVHNLMSAGVDVEFLWVPSHIGIFGNECADKLAKDALQSVQITVLPLELGELYFHIAKYIIQLWQDRWSLNNLSRIYKQLEPNVSFSIKYEHKSRFKDVMLSRLRFNCTCLNGHLYRINCHTNGNCDLCMDFEDPKHVLMDCVFYQDAQSALVSKLFSMRLPITYISLLSTTSIYDDISNFFLKLKRSI